MTAPRARAPEGALVHVVDDDPAIRDSLSWLFQSRGIACREWSSGEEFLRAGVPESCACLVLDMRMDGLSGIDVFDRMRDAGTRLPVVFLTGHAEVPLAVEALKKGAFDFVEKPFNDNVLVDSVIAALEHAAALYSAVRDRGHVEQRLARLTSRERSVLNLMLDGRLNKQIADDLGISMRTVEVHRARVFDKMGVRNAVELATTLALLKA